MPEPMIPEPTTPTRLIVMGGHVTDRSTSRPSRSSEGHRTARYPPPVTGTLALVGGDEFAEGCTFDADLLAAGDSKEVVVLATAAAYERPERLIGRATEWFSSLGARVEAPPVFTRPDALDDRHVALVRSAAFVYLGGGSPMHLRSVLKDSPLVEALIAAWRQGRRSPDRGPGPTCSATPWSIREAG